MPEPRTSSPPCSDKVFACCLAEKQVDYDKSSHFNKCTIKKIIAAAFGTNPELDI